MKTKVVIRLKEEKKIVSVYLKTVNYNRLLVRIDKINNHYTNTGWKRHNVPVIQKKHLQYVCLIEFKATSEVV